MDEQETYQTENNELPIEGEYTSDAAEENEEITATPDESPENDAEGEEEQPKKVSRTQKYIDKLNHEKHEALRQAEYWKGRAEATAAGKAETQEEAQAPVDDGFTTPKPKEEDYEDYAEFVEALADWKTEKKLAVIEAKKQQSEQTSKQERWVNDAKVKFSDFAEVVLKQPKDGGPIINQAMADAITTSDLSHEIAYYLGKNVNESARIAKLSPLAAAKEIGKLEAQLASEKNKQPQRTKTAAPDPIKPISGAKADITDVTKMSMNDYAAYRNRQMFGPNWKRSV